MIITHAVFFSLCVILNGVCLHTYLIIIRLLQHVAEVRSTPSTNMRLSKQWCQSFPTKPETPHQYLNSKQWWLIRGSAYSRDSKKKGKMEPHWPCRLRHSVSHVRGNNSGELGKEKKKANEQTTTTTKNRTKGRKLERSSRNRIIGRRQKMNQCAARKGIDQANAYGNPRERPSLNNNGEEGWVKAEALQLAW